MALQRIGIRAWKDDDTQVVIEDRLYDEEWTLCVLSVTRKLTLHLRGDERTLLLASLPHEESL